MSGREATDTRHCLEDGCVLKGLKVDTAARLANEELAQWIQRMAMPVGGWKCFHTAGFAPKNKLDWAWQGEVVHGNMARDEWDAMGRYKRFMQERDRRKISWVAAVERNPDWSGVNKGWHVHSMWTAECDIWRTKSFKRWANQWGVNKLKSIEGDDRAVAAYLGKYVLNDLCLVDWQVNGTLWHMHRDLADASPAWKAGV